MAECAARGGRAALPHLSCVVNATGMVIHTNLGRAPLSGRSPTMWPTWRATTRPSSSTWRSGARGSRHDHVAELICRLTGAEDAAVVNNNAAAVMMVLAEFARGREVVVSRGELIEIGGSFRIPDIMELSGARMVEVGTTNKTHLVRLRARASRPRRRSCSRCTRRTTGWSGFHEEAYATELARLAHDHGVTGLRGPGVRAPSSDPDAAGSASGQHTAAWSLAQGVDLVSFSGDKLLGAAQAGIIVGARRADRAA